MQAEWEYTYARNVLTSLILDLLRNNFLCRLCMKITNSCFWLVLLVMPARIIGRRILCCVCCSVVILFLFWSVIIFTINFVAVCCSFYFLFLISVAPIVPLLQLYLFPLQ